MTDEEKKAEEAKAAAAATAAPAISAPASGSAPAADPSGPAGVVVREVARLKARLDAIEGTDHDNDDETPPPAPGGSRLLDWFGPLVRVA